jgi:hypothetical protein
METAMVFVGSVYSTYIAVRIGAAIIDVLNRWRTGNWDVEE